MGWCQYFLIFLAFVLANKFWCFWCRCKQCLVGKTAIVTGGAAGIGFQVALGLAAKGCRVIIADIENLSQAVDSIKRTTHNPNIIGKTMDLQSFKSVRDFAKTILSTEKRLDILLCNAGIGHCKDRKITEDGLERTMQVNYFSHFLLTNLLIDLLKKTAPSRIIYTSSQMSYVSDLSKIEDMNPSEEYFNSLLRRFNAGVYSSSKLCMAGAIRIIGENLKGTGVTANVQLCGGVRTGIFMKVFRQERNYLVFILMAPIWIFGKTPEEGAQTLLHLAQSKKLETVTGQTFMEGRKFPGPPQLNGEFCRKIYKASIVYTKLEPHEIKC